MKNVYVLGTNRVAFGEEPDSLADLGIIFQDSLRLADKRKVTFCSVCQQVRPLINAEFNETDEEYWQYDIGNNPCDFAEDPE